ncbi:pleckstrin homology domain-containing family F member 1 [Megalops cyprinoides]|uniref:pleckstrin homology domain-containing family F member 1 n=1 Tax=Megalops cyprinoides TaxID=118141 RepID=UPI001864CE18|nr:pleckstrin homology domain-containing family F member 1 [Megalops cyprinoides]
MADQLAFTGENTERILAVESFFGPSGKPLNKEGRVLVGEGRLMKLCRRSPQPRMFFLFDDILVYGSILVHGHWYTNQQIIPLENVVVEDLEDAPHLKNQWLIRTPRKSFFVSAASPEEKRAWIEHIEECRIKRLEQTGYLPSSNLAASWIPDRASAICMRCFEKFTVTQRRHHCRQCGFVVCSYCSKNRFLIPNISHKPVRLSACHCYEKLQAESIRRRGNSDGNNSNNSDEDELAMPTYETSSDDEDNEERSENLSPQRWASTHNHDQQNSWSSYIRS